MCALSKRTGIVNQANIYNAVVTWDTDSSNLSNLSPPGLSILVAPEYAI